MKKKAVSNEQLGQLTRGLIRRMQGGDKQSWDVIRDLEHFIEEGIPAFIACDARPSPLDGMKVAAHRKGGKFAVENLKKIKLYYSEEQRAGTDVSGHVIRKELKDRPVLNVHVLSFLLEYPELVPEEWKGNRVFFWGTLYRSANRHLVVPYLYPCGSRWYWAQVNVSAEFHSDCPAALSGD